MAYQTHPRSTQLQVKCIFFKGLANLHNMSLIISTYVLTPLDVVVPEMAQNDDALLIQVNPGLTPMCTFVPR